MNKFLSSLLGLILISVSCGTAASARSPEQQRDLWQALQSGGYVVMLRHAQTEPGIGDPPNFNVDDCSTQRNLSPEGRRDARRIGATFQRYKIPIQAVLSSQWCRCIDTATLAFGRVQAHPALNSVFTENEDNRRARLKKTNQLIGDYKGTGNLILVTHAVNIQAITGLYLGSGDMVVAQANGAGGIKVIGQLDLPAQ